MNILERIKEIRESKNMSVYELAKKCNISRNTIYRWYTQNFTPSLESIQTICEKGFNISLVEFFAVDTNLIPATEETKELINIWSTLTDTQKQAVMQILKSYKKNS